ncbi:MAG: ester cyclase [Deltaproteobacteria bacterium]|jgi:ketosteroid isomerase-like protein|nr:ester cyclase [Deltaproteobacteria bacterium]MBW2532750.1 ester cyclase [Deltaproteobacteria bacterium]
MRKLLTSVVLASAVSLTGIACEDPPQPQQKRLTKPPTPPQRSKKVNKPKKAVKLTPQQKVTMIKDCWAAYSAQDVKKFEKCYGPKTVNEMVDYLPPRKTKGSKALFAANAPVRKAFPDMKFELAKIFVGPKDAVVVYATHGTHKGDLMGQKPTEKQVGYLSAQHLSWAKDGTVAMDRHYYDQGTFAGQLGFHEMPVRPALEPGKTGELEVVIAKKDKKEKGNLALYKKLNKLSATKDVDKMMEHFADDALFAYMAGPKDAKGKEAIKQVWDMWFKSSSDMKSTTAWSWAAGDYVLAAGRVSGTNDGDLSPEQKATNKKFSMRGVDILKFKDGKVVEYWMFANGFKFAVDLGLAEDPAAMAKKGDEEEGDDDKGDDPAAEEKKVAEEKAKEAPKSAPKAPPKDTKAAAKPEAPPPSTPKKTDDAYD